MNYIHLLIIVIISLIVNMTLTIIGHRILKKREDNYGLKLTIRITGCRTIADILMSIIILTKIASIFVISILVIITGLIQIIMIGISTMKIHTNNVVNDIAMILNDKDEDDNV